MQCRQEIEQKMELTRKYTETRDPEIRGEIYKIVDKESES